MAERLQKVISQWGVASRRQAEQMILEGRVRVNGQVAQLGQRADPSVDHIQVDDQLLQPVQRPQTIYLLLNKPIGVVSTCWDPQNRPTVLSLLPKDLQSSQGIHPVGRLDTQSTGALILTNDGELTFGLTHPSHQVPKTYQVWVEGHPSFSCLRRWREGIMLEGRKTLPAKVEVLKQRSDRTLLQIILSEGRNRQIRKVADLLGHTVIHLHRVAIGTITLDSPAHPPLSPGQYRSLTEAEILFLQRQLHLLSIRATATSKEQRL